ncbi:50S ribosomal protein L29 [bacterium]|jgi:ribosomal protein L29|nr:50S ribosomal protein L29 [bacterium]MBT4249662.1 50S ribosomal protein L29 [bacterium]MBT4926615.1 50S ribosomal protein L29 [bacterium]MBT5733827.1 50S ribosomal protein L29 [bacterium]MBT6019289.1 50S ribosomal protein L29 [bacterium]
MAEKQKLDSSIKELNSSLIDSQDSLQNLIFQKTMQQLEDLSQIKKTRKKIAKIKTLLNESLYLNNK